MDVNGSSRFRHRNTPSSDRFLAEYPRTTDHQSTANADENELDEDDIFSAGDFPDSSNHRDHYYAENPSSSSPRHRQLFFHHNKAFPPADSFGILAALPENTVNSNLRLHQKTVVSSPSSSVSSSPSTTTSSRFIPAIPKPPQERFPVSASFNSSRFHQPQSAPVNVPLMSMSMRHRGGEFDEIDEDEDGEDSERLPPHEMAARRQSPVLSSSVLEGVGRTLKGRDLRQFVDKPMPALPDGKRRNWFGPPI